MKTTKPLGTGEPNLQEAGWNAAFRYLHIFKSFHLLDDGDDRMTHAGVTGPSYPGVTR